MNKILITGGAGFIGSNLALKLIERGDEVTVLDCLSEQIHGKEPERTSPLYRSILDKVHFIKGSVDCKEDLKAALANNEIVVHLAAETGTGQSMYQIERYCQVNIMGTAMLLELLTTSKHCVNKVLIASSRSVYGEGKYHSDEFGIVYPGHRKPEDMMKGDFEVRYAGSPVPLKPLPTDEDSKLHPSSIYGITKLNQERMLSTICKAIRIPSVVFRFQNVYGPGQALSNPYTGILSIFSTQIKNGNGIKIFEDGTESRDFVYIDDIVNAILLGIDNDKANYRVFNVGSGIPIDVLTVAKTLIHFYGKEVPVTITGSFRIGDIRHNYADLSKISGILGYSPSVSFNEGIQKFANWVDSQEVQKDLFQESVQEMKSKGLLIE